MDRIATLTDFFEAFPDEEACVRRLYALRTEGGWTCPRCGEPAPSLLLSRRKVQCTRCSCQRALTAGTPMQRSHVPLRKWFLAAHLVASDKRGISACALARELRLRWETAYYLLQRIRGAMAESGAFNVLEGEVEVDDSYLGSPGGGLAGRGTDKAPFIVAANRGRGGCCVRAVADCSGGSYLEFGSCHLGRSAHVRADGWGGCKRGLSGWPGLDQRPFDGGDADASLPVVHHLISNLKSFVLGTFHGVTRERLQGYMDEFSWRYCHRSDPSPFSSLVADLLSGSKMTKEGLERLLSPQPPQPEAPKMGGRSAVMP